MRALTEGQRLYVTTNARVGQHRPMMTSELTIHPVGRSRLLPPAARCDNSPGGGGLSLHFLTVPHFHGTVIGGRGEDGVFIRHADPVDTSFVLMEVSDQQAFRMPP